MDILFFALSGSAILLASGTLIRLSALGNSLLILFSLMGMLVLVLYQKDQEVYFGRYRLALVFLASIILSLLVVHIQSRVKPVVAVALVLSALSVLLLIPAAVHHQERRKALSWTWFSFFILYLAFELSPSAWWFLDRYSRVVSYRLGNYFNLPVSLSITAMGMSALILCLAFVWATVLTLKRHWKIGLLVTAALIAVNHLGAIGGAWLGLGQWMSNRQVSAFSWKTSMGPQYTALSFIPLVFLFECLVLFVLFDRPLKRDKKRQDHHLQSTSKNRLLLQLAGAWLIIVIIAYVLPQWPAGGYRGRVVLYKSQMSSWDKPNFEQLGSVGQPGLFNTLPAFLRACGFEVTLTDSISAPMLKETDVFVVINFGDRRDVQEHNLINRFVHDGGTLMVFADHTNMGHLMEESNKLLAETPIRVNFDSAHYLDNYWNYSFATRLNSASRRNWDSDGVSVSVGASLSLLNYKAIPMLLGRYGFSDEANSNDTVRKNFLGDRRYSIHEPLGDILLEAASPLGRGKVFVCGDTAALQFVSLTLTHTRIADLFRWAVHGKIPNFPWGILLMICLAATWAIAGKKKYSYTLPLVLTISVALSVVCADWLLVLCYREPSYQGNIAYVDYSHIPLSNHQRYEDDLSDSYLIHNLIRNNYLPLIFKQFNSRALQESTLMVSVASTKPYSEQERQSIDAFLKSGGHVLIASSDRCSRATKSLLANYGISISNLPLGGVTPENNNQRITMYNANPLIIEEVYTNEVLCTAYEKYPVVVDRKVGHGQLTVIGDYGLLFNGRLEKRGWANPANIFFLRKLIGKSLNDE